MKKIFIICFFISLTADAQDAKEILRKAYQKCQSVNNGYYELNKQAKYRSVKDSMNFFYTCYFKKLQNDSLFSSAFHIKQFRRDTVFSEIIYTGDELITAYRNDSIATIFPKSTWPDRIRSLRHNITFYSPLTQRASTPVPNDSVLAKPDYTFKFINEEKINNDLCYHIRLNAYKETFRTSKSKYKTKIRDEVHYWIKKDDFLPVQYSTSLIAITQNDTINQYEKYTITNYILNNFTEESSLSAGSLPKYYKVKNYTATARPEMLPKDTIAPDWSLTSLKNEKISLKDLKGKLVLIEFFHLSSNPSSKALPALQSLYEKYKEKGLEVVAIDPTDKNMSADLEKLLSQNGVTFPVLLCDAELPKQYKVTAYPTLYLVDRNGKIIYMQISYGEAADKKLDEIVTKNL